MPPFDEATSWWRKIFRPAPEMRTDDPLRVSRGADRRYQWLLPGDAAFAIPSPAAAEVED